MDFVLALTMSVLIECSALFNARRGCPKWERGRKLSLLLSGYNGARNTGADVRVEEIVRQLYQILGRDNVRLTVLTRNPELSKGYFGGADQRMWPDFFPPFLWREVPRHDGVIACEGSMFKSKFANALSVLMIGSLGIAGARKQLSLAYGGEADDMVWYLKRMCARYCQNSMIITRTEESSRILANLGLDCSTGTDTAWTFEPLSLDYGKSKLRNAGWNGTAAIVGICPINPFWWPVRSSTFRALLAAGLDVGTRSQYSKLYFHRSGRSVEQAYRKYLNSLSDAIRVLRSKQNLFPVIFGMERLDSHACRSLAELLGGAPVFEASDYDMYELVSILRCCTCLVSSRYHGIVTTMPALIPSVGVSMDERIASLIRERGDLDRLIPVDDPYLSERLICTTEDLLHDADSIRPMLAKSVVSHLRQMALMGKELLSCVSTAFPELPRHGASSTLEPFLPPLSANLKRLIVDYPLEMEC